MGDDNDEKNLIEKTIEAVKKIAHVASEAAAHAMEPEPLKPGDKVVLMPMVTDGMMGEGMIPPLVVVRRKKVPKTATKKRPRRQQKRQQRNPQKRTPQRNGKSPAKAAKKKTGKKAVKKKTTKKSKR
jgi:hypothetical protein